MDKEGPEVIVGVGVVVENSDKEILMKKRKNSHGENEWALPGGKVDFGESFEEAALRELNEETGLIGQEPEVISLSNQLRYLEEGIHCVIIGVRVKVGKGEKPVNLESEKCQGFSWFALDKLPENIFEGSEQVLCGIKEKGEKIKYVKEALKD